ncbi:MAG: phenylalanine--tRNA ligase subunit beta [SAR324 cluster bacterium]|nr:phenylalanine--tRNA ligase subunit beta [SAR324 cluster bacterium]
MPLRVPLKWLAEYVDIDRSPAELAERLTLAGLEVETVTAIGETWHRDKIVVGHVLNVAAHPDADRLCLATVDHGGARPLTVVTGAPNVLRYVNEGMPAEPLKAPFAGVGAVLIDGHAGDGRLIKLKPTKIRGVPSEGMICSEMELGLSKEHEGILILPPDAPTGTPLVDYLGDHVLEFDIKGGFAHLHSVYGIARETAALTGKPLHGEVWRSGGEGQSTPTPGYVTLELPHPELCARYVALLVEGIVVGASPFWMQQRLNQAGMRPINAVVDVTNYVMLEMGQPIHAFDYHTLRGEGEGGKPLVRVRRARAGETMHTLDGAQRTFDEQMLLITDGGGAIAIAGLMGGQNSEVSDTTTHVLLESANFEFLNIRRTGQLLKLRTEAGDRFGKDLDPQQCLPAALRAAALIAEICGGRVHPEYGDLYPRPRGREAIPLDVAFVHGLLGVQVPREEIVRVLESLEFHVDAGDPLQVTPPSHRKDVTMAADLVEEVGRIHGYDRMPHTLIEDALPPQRRNRVLDGTARIGDLLIGSGLDEVITYSIISRADEMKLAAGHPGEDDTALDQWVAIVNPLDGDRAHMRRSILPGLLNTTRANLRFQPRVAIFETGAVFHPRAGQELPDEPRKVAALLTGARDPASWLAAGEDAPFGFYDIKGVAESLLAGLEISAARWERSDDPAHHPGRSARLMLGDRAAGHLGELHPRVTAAFDLPPQPVCVLELDLDLLLEHWREDRKMDPISPQPPVYEDVAFIVDAALPAERVAAMIAQTGRPLLKSVALFDHYRDEKLGQNKKSLAYALTYQADDRTLTDKEVAKVRNKIAKRLEKELGAVLRSGQ